MYGDDISEDDTYFYSDDFARMVQQDPTTDRTLLSDPNGTDRLNAAMVTDNLSLNLSPGTTSQIAGQDLVIDTETLIEQAVGGDGNDRIRGNDVNNRLDGGRGNDRLLGKGSADVLLGNVGNDRLRGGPGEDRLIGHQGNDRLVGGADDDRLIGKSGNDRLKGGSGSDILRGGAGDDWLYGQGGGSDRLRGNRGRDTFVLERGEGESIIQDFQDGRDRIGLSRGISFNQLDIAKVGNNAELSIGTDVLAILVGVRLNQLSQADVVSRL